MQPEKGYSLHRFAEKWIQMELEVVLHAILEIVVVVDVPLQWLHTKLGWMNVDE